MEILLVLVAAFCAGVLNTIAGGGTFLTFPALVFIGLPPVWWPTRPALWPSSPGIWAALWAFATNSGGSTESK